MTKRFSLALLASVFSVSTVAVSVAATSLFVLPPRPISAQQVNIRNGYVWLTLPSTGNQDDSWSCGPNSAARVLAFYGNRVDYGSVRSIAQRDHGIIPTKVCVGIGPLKKCFNTSEFKTGLEPSEIRDVMNRWEGGNAKYVSGANLDQLKSLLSQGKPVLVLRRVGSFKPGGIFGTWPEMHWVTVHGFNEQEKKIYYTETNGETYQKSYDEFLSEWDWRIGAGLASETFYQKGVKPKTMVWVDRTVGQQNSSEQIALIQRVHNQVIGGDGGPLYVDAAKSILSRGTLQDVRNFLVNDFSEAPIQRVHNQVIGGDGGPLYVDAAKSILRRDDASLQDVRNFLVNDFSEAPIQRIHNEVIGGDGGPLYVDAAKSILRRDGASLEDVRNFLITNFKR
jgi:uncharacterized protein YvpB